MASKQQLQLHKVLLVGIVLLPGYNYNSMNNITRDTTTLNPKAGAGVQR